MPLASLMTYSLSLPLVSSAPHRTLGLSFPKSFCSLFFPVGLATERLTSSSLLSDLSPNRDFSPLSVTSAQPTILYARSPPTVVCQTGTVFPLLNRYLLFSAPYISSACSSLPLLLILSHVLRLLKDQNDKNKF
jgi:hypothetical protein